MSELCIGEKVETIILERSSGAFGEYLGSSFETFGVARVDGVVFKVERNVEEYPYWRVLNVNTGACGFHGDPHCLFLAVREAAGV